MDAYPGRYEDGIGFGLLLGNLSAAESMIGAMLGQAAAIAEHGPCDPHGHVADRTRAVAAQAAQLSAALDKVVAALPAELRRAA